MHRGECAAWQVRNYSNYTYQPGSSLKLTRQNAASKHKLVQGRHVCNATTNYDTQYRIY